MKHFALWWFLWGAVVVFLAWRAVRGLRDVADEQPCRRTRPAVLETEPGIDLSLRDECDLIWSISTDHPGLDQLRAAIRDEQQNGDA